MRLFWIDKHYGTVKDGFHLSEAHYKEKALNRLS
jgi:hypothetical protein